MTKKKWFAEQFEKFEEDAEYRTGLLRLKLYEDILRVMEEQGVTRAELAKRLSCSKAYVSKLFNDSTNMTLHTLVRIALALGCDMELSLVPRLPVRHVDDRKRNPTTRNRIKIRHAEGITNPYSSAAHEAKP
ncbi:MAG: helix-turn-helix transcriptional regulator [Bacteroidetes bacterium]|nr:helix-turn-helix transcriptional regulator [Bacteroidota bacterium]